MGIYTPRANLYKPGGGSTGLILPDETVDIDKINDNMTKIDALLGARSVPSASSYVGSMDGDLVYAEDTQFLHMYSASDGALILPKGGKREGILTASSDADRNAKVTTPVQGDSVYRTDKNYIETYFGVYDVTTNPAGTVTAGWYPTVGNLPFFIARRNAAALPVQTAAYTHLSSSTQWTIGKGDFANLDPATALTISGITIPFAGQWKVSTIIHGVNSGVTALMLGVRPDSSAPNTPYDMWGLTVGAVVQSWTGAAAELTRRWGAGDKASIYGLAAGAVISLATGGLCELRLEYVGPPVGAP